MSTSERVAAAWSTTKSAAASPLAKDVGKGAAAGLIGACIGLAVLKVAKVTGFV